MEKILVIPGSESQIPLIQKVHKEGYEVVCINPCEDSPGFEYADYCIMEDALNKEAVLDAARKYTVSGVISDECDVVMPVVAYVGEQMNLHTLSSKDAELYTDKYQMRKFCETHCFNYPAYAKCRTVKEACDFFESIHCRKMMIKPLDSNSSRGVYKVSDENEIMEYFEKAIHYSRKEKAIICETYKEIYKKLMPSLDYWLYYGFDEGAMGFLDALAAGVKTIATPQGYHLDAKGGLTHPCSTIEDFIRVLKRIQEEKKEIADTVKDWTWQNYARKHLEIWHYLTHTKPLKDLYAHQSEYTDGIFSLLMSNTSAR